LIEENQRGMRTVETGGKKKGKFIPIQAVESLRVARG
jgi:hypothetical protein